jgi:hypothetical protein
MKIKYIGKKMIKYIEYFISTIDEDIKNKNINELKHNILEFKIGKNKKTDICY